MAEEITNTWYYLDTGEVGFDHEGGEFDGEFEVVANLDTSILADGDGAKIAAARELYAAAKQALIVINELQRNHIASLQGEYQDMIDAIEAAVAQAEGSR